MNNETIFDVLIIGSGAAGLGLALDLPLEANVAIISKSQLQEGSTYYAQGGIAAVLDETDTIDSHIEDTVNSGAGLCNEAAVRSIVENGRKSIEKLIEYGVEFSRDKSSDTGKLSYHLTKEGGHTHRRVIHAADATGREVESTLLQRVKKRQNTKLLEYHNAVDLIYTTN